MSVDQSGWAIISRRSRRCAPCGLDRRLYPSAAAMTHIRHISHIHHILRAACRPIPPIIPIAPIVPMTPTCNPRHLLARIAHAPRAPHRTQKHLQSAPRGYYLTFRLQKFAILLIQCLLSDLTFPQFCKVVSSFWGGVGVFLGCFQKIGMSSHPPCKGV